MKRANLAPKMGPKRVNGTVFGANTFSPTEMGLFGTKIWSYIDPCIRGQIRLCKGSIWKTLGPFWIFQ